MKRGLLYMAIGAALIAAYFALAFTGIAAGHVKGCHSRKCDRRISRRRHEHFWLNHWRSLPAGARYWTTCVSSHESGNRRIARESGFLSYFQWTIGTWHNAGGRGNPETHSWHEQAVKAWRWHRSHPYGQWPNTGEGGRCGS